MFLSCSARKVPSLFEISKTKSRTPPTRGLTASSTAFEISKTKRDYVAGCVVGGGGFEISKTKSRRAGLEAVPPGAFEISKTKRPLRLSSTSETFSLK